MRPVSWLHAHGIPCCCRQQKLKASTPGFIWYDADGVVRDGIKAVQRGKPIAISGRLYRWLDPFFQSVLTRRFLRLGGFR